MTHLCGTIAIALMLLTAAGCVPIWGADGGVGGKGVNYVLDQRGHQIEPAAFTSPHASSPPPGADLVVTFDPSGALQSVQPGNGVANIIVINTRIDDGGNLSSDPRPMAATGSASPPMQADGSGEPGSASAGSLASPSPASAGSSD